MMNKTEYNKMIRKYRQRINQLASMNYIPGEPGYNEHRRQIALAMRLLAEYERRARS